MLDREKIISKENKLESEKLRYKTQVVGNYKNNAELKAMWGYVFIYIKNNRYPDEESEFEFTLEQWEELKKNIPKKLRESKHKNSTTSNYQTAPGIEYKNSSTNMIMTLDSPPHQNSANTQQWYTSNITKINSTQNSNNSSITK